MAILKFIINLPAIILFVIWHIFRIVISTKYREYFLKDYSKQIAKNPEIAEEQINKLNYFFYITLAAIILILKFKN